MTTAFLLATVLRPAPEIRTYQVAGLERRAAIFAPAKPSDHPPLVFGFHGHGGNMLNASRSFHIQTVWPEAVVVYMMGLPTKGKTDPQGLKPGWQQFKDDEGGRDLAFFDAVFADVKTRFKVDLDRVYAMGHSNGGRFTYLLWEQRGDQFAAFAPSGSPSAMMSLKPKPVFHVAGEKDPLVSFISQKASVERIKRLNGCGADGKALATYETEYEGERGNDVVTFFHPGGHEYPPEAPRLIVDFFKTHKKG